MRFVHLSTSSLLAVCLVAMSLQVVTAAETSSTIATLNGLQFTLDNSTGAIRKLSYPGPGTLLDADAAEAGLVDVAYPLEEFEPMRLSARHSSGAVIDVKADRIVIRIKKLGPSRTNFKLQGEVAATVTLRADPDGRSVVMSCEVENRSPRPLRQIVFPEFRGLLPVAGVDNTVLKSCGFGTAPFRELVVPDVDVWYAVDNSTVEYKSGGMFDKMWARWLDLGGLNGGLSLFPRSWGWDPRPTVIAQLRQATKKLRLLNAWPCEVKPGAKWSSPEFVLTPHISGWAKGIEPYRDWVRSHVKRQYAMPKTVRDGLGFRSLWMSQNQPKDPTDATWRFQEIPGLAKEAREHGLREMVLWAWQPGFDASLPAPFPHLGTEKDLVDAIAASRKLGVNVAPFISVVQASPKTAGRYGLKVSDNNGWTYHPEMLPRWNPPYATGYSCVQVGPANAKWQDEVVRSCRRWADKGVTSICWDQYMTGQDKPTMQDLTRRIRDYARKLDPESSFSGEELWNIEIDAEWLDYTWDWATYRDCQAFINAFPAPRPNVNINRSTAEVRYAFMDNLFLNVWPSKPDDINGSERIKNVPELSKTLKVCAGLRERFLPYFTDGHLIGNCLLTERSEGIRMSAYVLPDRVIAIVLNEGVEGPLSFNYDLGPWLASHKTFRQTQYDENGRRVVSTEAPASGMIKTPTLRHLEMVIVEFTVAK
ncbi:MAG: DUF6259 domain-containing protein [Planctomycetaceae bacterium]|nr:DUF6259 domain-containing protein [Planctomycetaceae bacterium]